MTLHNKILPVALVAALLGGSVGALVMRHNSAADTHVAAANLQPAGATADNGTLAANDAAMPSNLSAPEQEAYRSGFTDGFDAARTNATGNFATRERVVTRVAPERVVYRTARRSSARSSRTAYYDYAPRQRSFWQKHRDKLTVAMGTGGGALLGGLIGGKKGAAIGALAGGGGSALYTYKIRRRGSRY